MSLYINATARRRRLHSALDTVAKTTLVSAAVGVAFAGAVMAQAAPDFATVDANGDGALSLEEVKAALPNVEDATIAAADANQDGTLDATEYAALIGG